MKRILFLLIPMLLLASCTSNGQADLNVTEAFTRMEDEDVVIIDVRTPQEYEQGHIEGARHIDYYGEDFEQEIAELPQDQEYVVYCQSGNRSGKTLRKMKEMGYEKVYNLEGGIKAWKEEGKEVVK